MQPDALQAFVLVAGKIQPWNGVDATVIAGTMTDKGALLYIFDTATQTWIPFDGVL